MTKIQRYGNQDLVTSEILRTFAELFMKKYIYFTILILMVAVPAMASAQVQNPNAKKTAKSKPATDKNHKTIQVNKLEVVDPNDEYQGVLTDPHASIDKNRDENDLPDYEENEPEYQRPYIINSPEPEEEDPLPNLFRPTADDEGAESEDEILEAGDTSMLHSQRMDISKMVTPVVLQLVNPQKGEGFVFPTPEDARLTSHFGPRRRRFHYGVDLAQPTGKPIYAAFDGVVRISKYNGSYGNLVVIRHPNGLETYYAHLSKRHVSPGTQVRAGDIIGLCGNTGRSYGSHLHFEIRYEGNAMNPENVVDCQSHGLRSPTLTLTRDSFRKVARPGSENASAKKGTKSTSNSSSKGNYSSDGKYYKVRSGDTLSRIASRNGTTVRKLCQLNGIKETTVLQIGQRLRIR